MNTGAELLARARSMDPTKLEKAFGAGATPSADDMDRPALVATLLSEYDTTDADLIRAITRFEIAAVREADAGGGDTLLACCWLLFMLGRIQDSAVVWEAKSVNYDTHCYIDSVFLVPQGVEATVEFAREHDLRGLLEWVGGEWLSDPMTAVDDWRNTPFSEDRPPTTATTEELAAWIRA